MNELFWSIDVAEGLLAALKCKFIQNNNKRGHMWSWWKEWVVTYRFNQLDWGITKKQLLWS